VFLPDFRTSFIVIPRVKIFTKSYGPAIKFQPRMGIPNFRGFIEELNSEIKRKLKKLINKK